MSRAFFCLGCICAMEGRQLAVFGRLLLLRMHRNDGGTTVPPLSASSLLSCFKPHPISFIPFLLQTLPPSPCVWRCRKCVRSPLPPSHSHQAFGCGFCSPCLAAPPSPPARTPPRLVCNLRVFFAKLEKGCGRAFGIGRAQRLGRTPGVVRAGADPERDYAGAPCAQGTHTDDHAFLRTRSGARRSRSAPFAFGIVGFPFVRRLRAPGMFLLARSYRRALAGCVPAPRAAMLCGGKDGSFVSGSEDPF